MKKLLLLISILALVSCAKSGNKGGPAAPIVEKKTEEPVVAPVIETKVISSQFLSRVGLHFMVGNGELGIMFNEVDGVTNTDKIKTLEEFQNNIISLHDTQNLKWFFDPSFFLGSLRIVEKTISFSENEVERVVKRALYLLRYEDASEDTISQKNKNGYFDIFREFETSVNFKTNYCISKVGSETGDSYIVAVDSIDNRANIYVDAWGSDEACSRMIDLNQVTSPKHYSKDPEDMYDNFNCYKVVDQKSSFWLVKELRMKKDRELKELILINEFNSIENCQEAEKYPY